MRNILLKISYDGSSFFGWQKQKNKTTVQGEIERVLKDILQHDIKLVPSGRTDAGVSAKNQYANFCTSATATEKSILARMNFLLPKDIRILEVKSVDLKFNSRYLAKQKTYVYKLYVSNDTIPAYEKIAMQVSENFNYKLFVKNAKMFKNEHDFTSFCSAESVVKSKVRKITDVKIEKHGDLIAIYFTGNGFLYNMVRIMVGTLVDISTYKLNSNIKEILKQKNRVCAGVTAKPNGLMLYDVKY